MERVIVLRHHAVEFGAEARCHDRAVSLPIGTFGIGQVSNPCGEPDLDDANGDHATRTITLTGAGRAFCAGDDRHEHVHPKNEAQARDPVDAIQRATRAIVFGDKPVDGAINGWAVGGGFEWAINRLSNFGRECHGLLSRSVAQSVVTGAVTSLLPALVGLNTARETTQGLLAVAFARQRPAYRARKYLPP